MLNHLTRLTLLCGLLLASGAFGQDQPRPAEVSDADKALAERFAALSQGLLRQSELIQPRYQQAAALLEGAHRLDPSNPRFLRMLIHAQQRADNRDAAIVAAKKLAAVEPRNSAAYATLIDLYLSGMEAADQRLDYLRKVAGTDALPPAVRSYAAARAAELLIEQGANREARQMTAKALEWNPVNPIAARAQWQLVRSDGTQAERTQALMTLVKASPRDPSSVGLFAQQLAAAGFVASSLNWFNLATQLARIEGLDTMPLYQDWAAELFIANEPFASGELVNQLIEIDPGSADNWFLRLLIDRASGLEEPVRQSLTRARSALLKDLAEVRALAGINEPARDALPDLSGDIATLRGDEATPELKAAYASAIADLLWLELYFAGPSDTSDRLLGYLSQIVDESNATLARLQGWNFLLRNRADEARVKLQAVADRDPLAALGLLRLYGRDDESMRQMTAEGRHLLTRYPSSVVGAFISGELRRYGVRVELPPELEELDPLIRRFTREWQRIYTEPGAFYVVRGRPRQVAHRLGEPILADIEIRNLSEYPLSISPDGAINPDLWFDARLQGVVMHDFSGVAFDSMLQELVLMPKQSIMQTVRLDSSGLNDVLVPNPSISFQVTFWTMTNPRTVATEQGGAAVVPGPVGQRVEFQRLVERVAAPLADPDQRAWRQVVDDLQGARPAVKMDRIDLLRAYVGALEQLEQNADTQRFRIEFMTQLNRRREDETPQVRTWATYAVARLAGAEDKAEILRQMRTDGDWTSKLLSLVIAQADEKLAGDVAAKLSGGDQPDIVRQFARATTAVIEQTPPKTEPQAQTPASR